MAGAKRERGASWEVRYRAGLGNMQVENDYVPTAGILDAEQRIEKIKE